MKNFISNKSKFIKVLTLVIMMITSVFALVGCSLTNPDQEEANASYDSSGNPRITSLSVDYAPFSISDDGRSQIIDGNSGVFSFVLPYYFNGNLEFLQEAMESAGYNLGDEFAYDQNSLGMNYFVDKELKTKCTYARTYAPFYASSTSIIFHR